MNKKQKRGITYKGFAVIKNEGRGFHIVGEDFEGIKTLKNAKGIIDKIKEENRFMDTHIKALTKEYGKRRAGYANIGWAQESDSIASKVYGKPCEIFTSTRGKSGKIYHNISEY